MAVIKYKDPVTGKWAKVGIPKADVDIDVNAIGTAIAIQADAPTGNEQVWIDIDDDEIESDTGNNTGVQMDLLWENASTASNWVTQTLLVDVADKYTSFLIEVASCTSNYWAAGYGFGYFIVHRPFPGYAPMTGMITSSDTIGTYGGATGSKSVQFPTSGGITIVGTNDNRGIPLRIWGFNIFNFGGVS